MMDQQKPFVLITGAAVRLGKYIAIDFAKRGYEVGIHYHSSQEEAFALRVELQKLGKDVHLFQGDLTDISQVQELCKRIIEQKFKLAVLVNSASIMPKMRIDETLPAVWDETMNLNLRAVWLLSTLLRGVLTKNNGVIINFADSGINKIWVNYPVYLISKTALEKLSQILAKEFAPEIRVVTISPGLILKSQEMDPEVWNQLIQKTPIRREVFVHDLLTTIQYCVENKSITGSTITLDGGYQLVS